MSRKPIIKVCVIYVGSILFAAVVYYLMFLVNTTSFYISAEFNERGNGRYIDRSPDILYMIHDREEIPFSIDDFNQKIKPTNDEILAIYDELDSLRRCEIEMEERFKYYSSRFAESKALEIELYREDRLTPIRDSVDNFEKNIELFLYSGVSERELIIRGTYVDLARLKSMLAEENVRVSNEILNNYSTFGNRDVLDTLNSTKVAILNINNRIRNLEVKKRNCYNLYENSLKEFHNQRIAKVTFGDFLYFSLLIATSNSFGDILGTVTK